MKGLFDTNILLDHLNGVDEAANTIDRYDEKTISRMTWMEVLAGATSPEEEKAARELLATFRVVEMSEQVAESAVSLRKSWPRKLKLPDAVVYATAKTENCPLITRNTKDFDPATLADIVVPYNLGPTP